MSMGCWSAMFGRHLCLLCWRSPNIDLYVGLCILLQVVSGLLCSWDLMKLGGDMVGVLSSLDFDETRGRYG